MIKNQNILIMSRKEKFFSSTKYGKLIFGMFYKLINYN